MANTATEKKRGPIAAVIHWLLSPWRWMKRYWRKLLLVTLVILGSYCLYLDAVIKDRFTGTTWHIPAQIYARPLVLTPGKGLSLQQLNSELIALGYQRVTSVSGPGEYAMASNRVHLWSREFLFADGPRLARSLAIEFDGRGIIRLKDRHSGTGLQSFALEPRLLSRIVSQSHEDRELVRLEQVPQGVVQALLLTEDRDFYRHSGISPLGIARALVANIRAGRRVQGGSTLTQQLVKNLFLTRSKTLWRKVNEALMALLIEARFSKDAILEAYLNEVFLGQDGANAVHGIGLASRFYFARPLNEISLSQAATLVAMVKGPSYYNPRRYPERVLKRRNLVLRMMFEQHHISREEYETEVGAGLAVLPKRRTKMQQYPGYVQMIRRELDRLMQSRHWQGQGLRVFTAFDPEVQHQAQEKLSSQLPRVQRHSNGEPLQGAMVISHYATGEVIALVDGRNANAHGFNRALDASRQVGSLIKPAVYLAALERPGDYTLATPIVDEPITLKNKDGKTWSPQNADKQYHGRVPMLDAFSQSLNVPAVKTGMRVGLTQVAEVVGRLGVETEIPLYPALTLGAVNLTPMEVSQMYQTLANQGDYIPLHGIRSITSHDGEPLWVFPPFRERRVDKGVAYLLQYAMQQTVKTGTAHGLEARFPGAGLAGKTGTTDDYRDSWFVGFDRRVLVTTWVGRDDNLAMGLSGSSGAMEIYAAVMEKVGVDSIPEVRPAGVTMLAFDVEGQPLAADCEGRSFPALANALGTKTPCKEADDSPWWKRLFSRRD